MMLKKVKHIFRDVYYFFPIQLLLEHFRRHYTIVLLWLLLWLYVTGLLGYKFGIYTLFLSPEYLGKVNLISYFILGFSLGIFFMAFHITSYITSGYQFPVIATLPRPFYRFTLNNLLIPAGFILTLIIKSIHFQAASQYFNPATILLNILGLVAGIVVFYLFTFGYFFFMNRGFHRIISISEGAISRWRLSAPLQRILWKDRRWKREKLPAANIGTVRVGLYLYSPLKIKRAPYRITQHPDHTLRILRMNHSFAVVFSVSLIIGLLAIGIFMDHPVFNVPAASSILLICTLALLIYTVFHTLFKDYTLWFFIGLFALFSLFVNNGMISRIGEAYGLNYQLATSQPLPLPAPDETMVSNDSSAMVSILSRWKEKNTDPNTSKPLAVFIQTSGGGLKAALWTYYALATADSMTEGRLLDHTLLMTGASGGMIGASFLRQLMMEPIRSRDTGLLSDSLFQNLSADILNPVTLHLALKDWFFTFRKFHYGNQVYRRDRGWALEERLNRNTGYILDHPLSYYHEPERQAIVPMVFLTPSVLNNGKQMLISPLSLSFMEKMRRFTDERSEYAFTRIYHAYQPDSLRFLSALRMNASYPVISPVVTLPGNPPLQVTDAGFRDNFGFISSLSFIHYFSDWFDLNTSGLVIIHIRSVLNNPAPKPSAIDFLRPFQSINHAFFDTQQMNGMFMQQLTDNDLHIPVYFIPLNLDERKKRISLSWHLTRQEKERIRTAIHLPENNVSLGKIKSLFPRAATDTTTIKKQ